MAQAAARIAAPSTEDAIRFSILAGQALAAGKIDDARMYIMRSMEVTYQKQALCSVLIDIVTHSVDQAA